MKRLSKKLNDNPELTKLIKDSVDRFKAMTPEQQEAEMRKQRKSWARQDMDR
jgi:hypothetical protein